MQSAGKHPEQKTERRAQLFEKYASPFRIIYPLNRGSQVKLTPKRLKVRSSTSERITVE